MLQDASLRELNARALAGLAMADPRAIDVSPEEAWAVLGQEETAQLIDVRTTAEWSFVGVPHLRDLGKNFTALSWRNFPDFAPNEQFAARLCAQFPDKSTPLFFLCRSGGRSLDAALAMREMGYAASFNIAGGFEGDLDQARHRSQRNGWKAAGLPWEQS